MRLTELDPAWLYMDGRSGRVGLVFRSPFWGRGKHFWQTCFFQPTPLFACDACCHMEIGCCPHSQMGAVRSSVTLGPDDYDWCHLVQGCRKECAWACTPHQDVATLENISITPSLDGSAGGLWHGYITNGEIVGGL